MNGNCKFCKIVKGDLESYTVFEDNMSLAFLDYRPLFPGHCLLVPKEHYNTIIDMPALLIAPLFTNARLIVHAMEVGLSAEGSFIAINNRVSQSVPHLHIHIVPRRKKDGLRGFFWPRSKYRDRDHIMEVQSGLRSAVARIQSE
jgi:histidine triad (HIT) family protein